MKEERNELCQCMNEDKCIVLLISKYWISMHNNEYIDEDICIAVECKSCIYGWINE